MDRDELVVYVPEITSKSLGVSGDARLRFLTMVVTFSSYWPRAVSNASREVRAALALFLETKAQASREVFLALFRGRF